MSNIQNELNKYLAELNQIYKAGNATEHSYRLALQRLLENITQGLTITNEPKRIACGAPDYIVTRKNIPVGYIEAKDIGMDLNSKQLKEQLERYRASLDNLLITDYLTFQLFENREQITSVTIGKTNKTGIEIDSSQFDVFAEMISLFTGYQGQNIRTSEHLSKIMATKAKLMANIIKTALDAKDNGDSNSLEGQLSGFREVLIPDITHKTFADIYAQTIAYGMFTARLNDETSDKFSRRDAAELIPQSNPFLQEFFQYIAGYKLDDRIRWLVDDLADLFNYVDMDEVMKEFGKADHDPVIHFYETFLAEYDPVLRKSRGVWYTPKPVVQFIVQAVDDILKQEFEIPQGLADSSKVKLKQPEKKKDGSIKEEEIEYHKVQILDPATGTGTFLAEVVRNIYLHFKDLQGMWNGYAAEHLIPRINGFEILMASYVMAHLKLDMLLKTETGYKPDAHQRLRIYLTNSLEEAHAKIEIPFAKWLSDEANEASRIKEDVPVMVVLGNPPYSGESANKGKWIENLMKDYKKEPAGGVLQERNSKWLNDDYVKFIRYGQYFVEKNGEGILAYINNHSFLDNPTFRGMRWKLLQAFDRIYILDLHGNSKKKETTPDGNKDENVFDIQQGVSINIFVKTGRKKAGETAKVFHHDLYGKRTEKYGFLLNNNINSVAWNELPLTAPQYFFVSKNDDNKEEYEEGFSVQELFPVNSVGIVTARDNFTIHDSMQDVKNTIKEFLNLDIEAARTRFDLGKDARDWSVAGAKKDLTPNPDFNNNIVKISYRPFDIRHTYFTGHSKGFHCMPRGGVMRHFLKGENIGLAIVRQTKMENWKHIVITNTLTTALFVEIKDNSNNFPLYLYPKTGKIFADKKRKPNLNPIIVKKITKKLGLQYTEEKENSNDTFAPIDLLDYIYAVLHSPAYRERYKEFLKIDFPRVPYPQDVVQFRALATLGAKLRRLHLLENVEPQQGVATYPKEGNNKVELLSFQNGKVWINDTQYFDNVPSVAWEFYIGGYQPAQKWLKDRKGRVLSYDDILHYQRIITVLLKTEEAMREVDEVMEEKNSNFAN